MKYEKIKWQSCTFFQWHKIGLQNSEQDNMKNQNTTTSLSSTLTSFKKPYNELKWKIETLSVLNLKILRQFRTPSSITAQGRHENIATSLLCPLQVSSKSMILPPRHPILV